MDVRTPALTSLVGVRVCYLAFEPFPNAKGSGTRISALLTGLVAAGAEVTLLTLPPSAHDRPLPSGIEHRPLAVYESNPLDRALEFRERVARELRGLRADALHFRGVFEGDAALVRARELRAPAIFEVNGLPSVEWPYHHPGTRVASDLLGRVAAVEERLLRSSDAVLTQSNVTRAHLLGRVPSCAPLVLRNAAEPTLFARPAVEPTEPVVFYAGTFSRWQGVVELLAAHRRVLRATPARLRLVGPRRKAQQRWLRVVFRRLKLDDSTVELLDPLAPGELARAMAGAQLCVAPLRADERNLFQGASPIKLYEYMACARPVLASALPAAAEIVRDGIDGTLCRPTPAAFAEQILELLGDPERRARLGSAGRARIVACDSWAHRAAELTAAYSAWLGERTSPTASA